MSDSRPKELTGVLSVSHLSVSYDLTPVLWDISLSIPGGLMVGIIGPNGAGKSTFIKAVLELVRPISGRVRFFNEPLKKVRKRVAYVPQRETVDWHFPITVLDLVLMGRYGRLGILRWPSRMDYLDAEKCLEKVGMLEYRDRQIGQLSGGQQQRVFIARALLQDADLYFLDEPFTGIDHATETIMMSLLRELVTQNKTVFIVHHDLNIVTNYFDWVIMFNKSLIAYGPLLDVYNAENLSACYGTGYAVFGDTLFSKK